MKKTLWIACFLSALAYAGCSSRPAANEHDEENTEIQNDKKTPADKEDTPSTTVEPPKTESLSAPSAVKVFIDNSGSMKGYFEADGNFIRAISNLKSMDNGSAYFWGEETKALQKITPSLASYSNFGADTPFPIILARLEALAQENSLNFLVTDGIIGMKSSENLKKMLPEIQDVIKDSVNNYPGIAAAVFRFTSGYVNKNSHYYTCQGRVKLPAIPARPYFVIAIGRQAQLRWFLREIATDESLALYQQAERITFGIHDHEKAIPFNDSKKIKNGKLKGGVKEINLTADLPLCLLSDVGPEYIRENIEITLNGTKHNSLECSALNGRSITITHSDAKHINQGKNIIHIKLQKKIPPVWLETYSSENDAQIDTDPAEQGKTFALSYLLNGLKLGLEADNVLIDTQFEFVK